MSLFLDIGTGSGLASSTGIRPYLPPLLAGALARGDVGIDFDGTDFRFLESTAFLAAIVVLAVVAFLVERSAWRSARAQHRRARDPFDILAGLLGLGLGALLFAGTLADRHGTWWPGIIGGLVCAFIAQQGARSLLTRTRARLDAEAAGALFLYAEAAGLLVAGLSVLIPPVSVVFIAFFLWLRLGGRRREGEKYAGLRILR